MDTVSCEAIRASVFVGKQEKEGRMDLIRRGSTFVSEVVIDEVRARRVENAPLQIISGELNKDGAGCILTLNKEICKRHNFPVSLDLPGKTLVCTFKSWVLPPNDSQETRIIGDWDTREMKANDLVIDCVDIHTTTKNLMFGLEGSSGEKTFKTRKTVYLVKFTTLERNIGRFSPEICPFYRFNIVLGEDEYNILRSVPSGTVFRFNFKLKE